MAEGDPQRPAGLGGERDGARRAVPARAAQRRAGAAVADDEVRSRAHAGRLRRLGHLDAHERGGALEPQLVGDDERDLELAAAGEEDREVGAAGVACEGLATGCEPGRSPDIPGEGGDAVAVVRVMAAASRGLQERDEARLGDGSMSRATTR